MSRSMLEIRDNQLVQKYETVQYQMPVDSVMEYIKTKLGATQDLIATPVLPIGCRSYFRNGDSENYLIEVAPGKKTFNYAFYETDDIEAIEGSVEVMMPWQYFLFNFTKAADNPYNIESTFNYVKLFWATQRFSGWHSRVYTALLPNISNDASVCLGDAYPASDKSTCDRIEAVVNEFYDHTFNNDLGTNIPYEDIDTWVTESRRSRLCYMDWRKEDYPFMEHIRINPDTLAPNRNIDLNTLLLEAVRGGQPLW